MAAVNKVGLVAVPVGIALVFVAGRFFVDVNRSYTFLIVPAVTLAVVLVTFLPQVRSGLQRRRLLVGGIPAEATVLDAARSEIMRSTDGNPPPLLDPFCGGGSIPLEGQRLGLEAHASDPIR